LIIKIIFLPIGRGVIIVRIGIVTITNNGPNYGNQLQNFAVLKFLEEIGISNSETLYNVEGAEYWCSFAHKIKNYVYVILKKGDYKKRLKELRFDSFGRKYLRYTKPIKGNVPVKLVEKYDFFVCGSDQIWNPTFSCNNRHLSYTFLGFAPENKRISFAASIGISKISDQYIDEFVKGVRGFKNISVREHEGADLIKELTGREATVLLDPTMLIDKEEWSKIMKKPKGLPEKYILCYFLGNISAQRKKELDSISQIHNLGIVYLNTDDSNEFQSVGPREFLYMLAHADLICTDSFHGSAFSINFQVPFIVYDREDRAEKMNSRLNTLLKKFELENRKRENIELKNALDIDYSKSQKVLLNERNIAKDFLTSAFQNERR